MLPQVGWLCLSVIDDEGSTMIIEEIRHHLDRIEAAQQRCEEQPTDIATIVVLLNALAMAVKDLLREAIP
jgi:hypothetical protein